MALNLLVEKRCLIHIIILLAIALAIGVYLIATTALIAQDGAFYIERAQKFANDSIGVIKGPCPFGYPFLIFMAHKFVSLFGSSLSVDSWIYSAQGITLLCRLLALIPLYFIGKEFVGRKLSFWAILILIMLPYPARFGSDVLRDWPHILFLATGFLFLLLGAKQGKWWVFGIAGLVAGLGHMVRPECAQLVVYGVFWLLLRLLSPKPNMSRPRLVCALLVLLIGFAVPTVPYLKAREKILPSKLDGLLSLSWQVQSEKIRQQNVDNRNQIYTAASLPGNITKAFGRLAQEISDDLMYFFVPALLIGICSRFRKRLAVTDIEVLFMAAFVVLNVIMMILLYCNYEYISRRHCLLLVVFLIFYVPGGLQALGDWLKRKFSEYGLGTGQSPRLWFFVLLVVGMIICLPKLLRPMRIEKQSYRVASNWLKENTNQEDIIAVPDKRISFYAERKGLVRESGNVPPSVAYAVRIVASKDEKPHFKRPMREEKSFWVDEQKEKKLVIYKAM